MSLQRGIDGSEPLRAQPIEARAGAYEERRAVRAFRLAATLACPRCDAPVALAGRTVRFSEQIDCPFCRHDAPLRDFLSLATPTRPARVEVRARLRSRAVGG
jgi:transposase-like protein